MLPVDVWSFFCLVLRVFWFVWGFFVWLFLVVVVVAVVLFGWGFWFVWFVFFPGSSLNIIS